MKYSRNTLFSSMKKRDTKSTRHGLAVGALETSAEELFPPRTLLTMIR